MALPEKCLLKKSQMCPISLKHNNFNKKRRERLKREKEKNEIDIQK